MKFQKLLKMTTRLRTENLHLQSAIETLLSRLAVANPLTVTFDAEIFQEDVLTPKAKQDILNVVREQLRNIARSPDASEVYVSLGRTRQRTYLAIRYSGQTPNRIQKRTGLIISDIGEGVEMRKGEAPAKSGPSSPTVSGPGRTAAARFDCLQYAGNLDSHHCILAITAANPDLDLRADDL